MSSKFLTPSPSLFLVVYPPICPVEYLFVSQSIYSRQLCQVSILTKKNASLKFHAWGALACYHQPPASWFFVVSRNVAWLLACWATLNYVRIRSFWGRNFQSYQPMAAGQLADLAGKSLEEKAGQTEDETHNHFLHPSIHHLISSLLQSNTTPLIRLSSLFSSTSSLIHPPSKNKCSLQNTLSSSPIVFLKKRTKHTDLVLPSQQLVSSKNENTTRDDHINVQDQKEIALHTRRRGCLGCPMPGYQARRCRCHVHRLWYRLVQGRLSQARHPSRYCPQR